ncbi:transposase [Lysinibacillus fusiformis]|nr:transposase [Lysinibacillus fusiformis]
MINNQRFPGWCEILNCHTQDGKKPLAICKWTCPVCGIFQDRDINASCNIEIDKVYVL